MTLTTKFHVNSQYYVWQTASNIMFFPPNIIYDFNDFINEIKNINKDIEQLCHKPGGLLVIISLCNQSLVKETTHLEFQSMRNYACIFRYTNEGTSRIKHLHQWEETTRHSENPRVTRLCPRNTVS